MFSSDGSVPLSSSATKSPALTRADVRTPSSNAFCTMSTSAIAAARRAAPTKTTALEVVRTLTNLRRGSERDDLPTIGIQAVTEPSYGLDRTAAETPIDLVSEVADVHLDDVGIP